MPSAMTAREYASHCPIDEDLLHLPTVLGLLVEVVEDEAGSIRVELRIAFEVLRMRELARVTLHDELLDRFFDCVGDVLGKLGVCLRLAGDVITWSGGGRLGGGGVVLVSQELPSYRVDGGTEVVADRLPVILDGGQVGLVGGLEERVRTVGPTA